MFKEQDFMVLVVMIGVMQLHFHYKNLKVQEQEQFGEIQKNSIKVKYGNI